MTALALACSARTDIGPVRAGNEDSLLVTPRLVAVADGVGGQAAGEVASRTVVNALAQLDKTRLREPLDEALAGAVRRGNQTLRFLAACRPGLAGMSTTLTAVALGDDGAYVVANIGDSRTYLLRDAVLRRLTRDDSLVQELLDRGHVSAEQARSHPQRSVVLAALDGDARREPMLRRERARAGDRLLLCSDGLTDVVDDDELRAALAGEDSRERCATRLLEHALAAGARDNVSVVVADVFAAPDAAGWG